MRAKIRKAVIIVTFCCLTLTAKIALSQDSKANVESSAKFANDIVGNWEMKEVNAGGRPTEGLNYGPSTFTENTWTMRTHNGTYVFELTEMKVDDATIECMLVDKTRKISYPALLKIVGDQLVIARELGQFRKVGGKPEFSRPDNFEPGGGKLVYTMVRLPANTDVESDQKSISIHWFEGEKAEKTLVRCTIRANYGGNLKYFVGGEVAKRSGKTEEIGTAISGELKKFTELEQRVSLKIASSAQVDASDVETSVVRTESVSIETTLQLGKTVRINCGGDRWCELTLE